VALGHTRSGRSFVPSAAMDEAWEIAEANAIAHGIDMKRIVDLAATLAACGAWNCPTLVMRRRRLSGRSSTASVPEVEYQPALTRDRWDRALARRRFALRSVPNAEADAVRSLERLHAIVGEFHAAGAPLLIGTDAPNPYVVPGASLWDEVDEFIAAGLSPFDAVACATRNAAAFLGRGKVSGTITEGKVADVVLYGEDPLQRLDRGSRIPEMVIVAGRYYDRQSLARLRMYRRAWAASPERSSDCGTGLATADANIRAILGTGPASRSR